MKDYLIDDRLRRRKTGDGDVPSPVPPQPQPPAPLPLPTPTRSVGGIATSSDDTTVRSHFDVRRFVPWRGPFLFPTYNTLGIRVTNDEDVSAQDGVHPVGYSYWRNINAHKNLDHAYVMLGLERRRGGKGPSLFLLDKRSWHVGPLGPLFNDDDARSWSEAEGWYFSAQQPTMLYVVAGAELQRYDVDARTTSVVFRVATGSIWQAHSSSDDRMHCATHRDASGTPIGVVVFDASTNKLIELAIGAGYDEAQLDKTGRWLIIKESNNNRMLDLQTNDEHTILDAAGAVGHSDTGPGIVIGEDDYAVQPGAMRLWNLETLENGVLYHMTDWTSMARHVAWASDGVVVSCASRADLPRANELVYVPLDGQPRAVAPVMTDFVASGGQDDYRKLPKANVDPHGELAIWTTNLGSARLDAFIVRLREGTV